MLVFYSTRTQYSLADLRRLIATEEVGYDPCFSSSARLVWSEQGMLFEGEEGRKADVSPAEGCLHPAGTIGWMGQGYPAEYFTAPVWLTAMAGYAYKLVGHKNGRDQWEYKGAGNGFLSQNLLPEMTDAVVSRVKGTFGVFTGPDALEEYRANKSAK